jgi:hypothetical protein
MWLASRQSSQDLDDFDKISWIGNLLGGNPGIWWSSIANLRKEHARQQRTCLEVLWLQTMNCFGRRRMPFEEELRLLDFSQDNLGIFEFNTKFSQLAACIDWSRDKLEAALYLSKLNQTYVRHLRSFTPMPRTVDSLMDSTSLFDPSFLNLGKGLPAEKRVVSRDYPIKVRKPEVIRFQSKRPGHSQIRSLITKK